MSPYMRRNLEEAAKVARSRAEPELAFLRESFKHRSRQMTKPLSVQLRALVETKPNPFWEGQAKQAMEWAADILDAAEKVIQERTAVECVTEAEAREAFDKWMAPQHWVTSFEADKQWDSWIAAYRALGAIKP